MIDEKALKERILSHPLIAAINDAAEKLANVRLLVVIPGASGWVQTTPATKKTRINSFCKCIQSNPEGAKLCQMCHVLMAVAACRGGPLEQKCHAGASVLVAPISCASGDCVAVLSSCTFADEESWKIAKATGASIGLNCKELQDAYKELPKLDPERIESAKMLMFIMAEAVKELQRSLCAQEDTTYLKNSTDHASSSIAAMLDDRLRHLPLTDKAKKSAKQMPILIHVLKQMIDEKPALAYSVKEISGAARVSPNHLSAIFQKHMNTSFLEYVTIRRMEMAKELLRDLTLNVTEVAFKVGYPDSGYFTRRFKQMTGMAPKVWRQRKLSV